MIRGARAPDAFAINRGRTFGSTLVHSHDVMSQPPLAAMSKMGRLMNWSAMEPWKLASPNAKTPPSTPVSQYPPPSEVEAMP